MFSYKEPLDEKDFEEYIKGVELSTWELEKLAAFLLMYGYSQIYIGAEIDVLEVCERNFTAIEPDLITIYGQQFILVGYICLYIVSYRRYYTECLNNKISEVEIDLSPFKLVADAYGLSVFANYLRLVGFSQIHNALLLREKENDQ